MVRKEKTGGNLPNGIFFKERKKKMGKLSARLLGTRERTDIRCVDADQDKPDESIPCSNGCGFFG